MKRVLSKWLLAFSLIMPMPNKDIIARSRVLRKVLHPV